MLQRQLLAATEDFQYGYLTLCASNVLEEPGKQDGSLCTVAQPQKEYSVPVGQEYGKSAKGENCIRV